MLLYMFWIHKFWTICNKKEADHIHDSLTLYSSCLSSQDGPEVHLVVNILPYFGEMP